MDVKRELNKLKLELIMTKPFFGNVLYSLEFREDPDIGMPLKAEGIFIKYSENDIDMRKLTVSRLRYYVLHEMYRILMLYEYRKEGRDEKIWGIVCDMAVEYRLNSLLEEEFSKLNPPPHYDPSMGLYLNKFMVFDDEKFKRETEEGLHRKLLKNYRQNDGELAYIDEVFSLNLKKSELSRRREETESQGKDELAMQKYRVESIISESVTKDRLAGNNSSEGIRILGKIEGKKISWANILRRHLQIRFTDETSFSHPDNRFHWNEMVIPDFESREDFLELLVILDLSSSMEEREVNEMLFQIQSLSEQFDLKGRILGYSTEVVLDKKLNVDEIKKNIERYSFGGTDWNCIPKYIKEKRIKYGFAVTITDGGFYEKPVDMSNHMWILTEGNRMSHTVINRVIEL